MIEFLLDSNNMPVSHIDGGNNPTNLFQINITKN